MRFLKQWVVRTILELNHQERIDAAKAAVQREIDAIDEELARAPLQYTIPDADNWAEVWGWRTGRHAEKGRLRRMLEDGEALLAYHERRAGALSESTAGGELSEVER